MFVQFDIVLAWVGVRWRFSGVASKNYKRGRKSSASHIEIKLDAASNALIGSFRNKPTPHIIFSNDRMGHAP